MSETKVPTFHVYGDFTDEEFIDALRTRHLNEEQAFALEATLQRLRSLLDGLVKAVEPFATDAMFLNGIAGACPLRVPEYVDVEDHELGSTIGDLRRAREAYLKAKGV